LADGCEHGTGSAEGVTQGDLAIAFEYEDMSASRHGEGTGIGRMDSGHRSPVRFQILVGESASEELTGQEDGAGAGDEGEVPFGAEECGEGMVGEFEWGQPLAQDDVVGIESVGFGEVDALSDARDVDQGVQWWRGYRCVGREERVEPGESIPGTEAGGENLAVRRHGQE
jgi:hypothetical protein